MLSDTELFERAAQHVAQRYGPDYGPVLIATLDNPSGALFNAKQFDNLERVLVGGLPFFFVYARDGSVRQLVPDDIFQYPGKPPGDPEDQLLIEQIGHAVRHRWGEIGATIDRADRPSRPPN